MAHPRARCRSGVLTGPTRDGTLWIEDGEIRGPATDVRITDSLLGTLERVAAVGDAPRLVYDWWNPMHSYSMCYRVPVVKIAACHISGASALD
jgi:predicted Zn-dependent protease